MKVEPQRFRFVHAADLHLDTPFEGLRDVAPEVSRALREASLDAFDALVDLCLQREAAFLLVAGDVYDGAERGLRAQLRFRQGLERLSEAGIQVFVVHGNHDPSEEGWSALREWPAGTRVFGSDRVEQAAVERDGQRLATIHGISYPRRDVHENLSLAFPRGGRGASSEPTGLRIGLLHCNAGGSADHAPYAACSVADLASADLDYWALGHVHGRRTLGEDPWIVYPGNLQGRSPRPTEQGAKGAVLVEAELAPVPRVVDVSFEALDRVRFLTVELDVSGSVDLAEVERSLQGRADALRDAMHDAVHDAHPGRGLVLTARLVGSSDVQRDLARKDSPTELLESLRDGRRGEEPFVWWGSLVSDVTRPIDREGLRERDDFCAEILNLADELAADPEALQRFRRDALGELPDKLQNVALPESSESDPLALLRRAEREALARVSNDEPGGAS